MKPDEHPSVDWLAFRYLSGELSDDECEAFERQLETSQTAREAVASGVELAHAVRFAYEDELSVTPSRLGQLDPSRGAIAARRAGWAAVGILCASLLIVLWLAQRPEDRVPIASNDGATAAQTAELAEIWIATRDELALQAGEAAVATNPEWLTDANAEPVLSFSLDEEHAEPVLPSWMLAAVSASHGERDGVPAKPAAESSTE